MESKCIYCDEMYDKDSEHVFPHGLGGEKVFVDFVCKKCNSKFSGLESELYQKSPVALIRSVEGVKGYKKNNGSKAFLKAPILLTYDEENKIVYEVSQHDEMKIMLKSQIVDINGKYFLEGSNEENIELFIQKLKGWKNMSFIAITRLPSDKDKSFDYIRFHNKAGEIKYELINTTEKLKSTILIQDFSKNHELYKNLSPRLYLDDNQDIKIRAKTISEGINFLHDFLKYTTEPRLFKSFSATINDNGIIYVGQSFLGDKLERAVVKIMLNILIHYFPKIKTSKALRNHIEFVNSGEPKIIVRLEEKNDLMDLNDKTHNVFIHQFEDNIRLRLSLFNGQMIFTNIIPKLKILKHNEYCRFVNDYNVRKNRFETCIEMLESFVQE